MKSASLEDAYLELTGGAIEYQSETGTPARHQRRRGAAHR
jgi:hypothetical protein